VDSDGAHTANFCVPGGVVSAVRGAKQSLLGISAVRAPDCTAAAMPGVKSSGIKPILLAAATLLKKRIGWLLYGSFHRVFS